MQLQALPLRNSMLDFESLFQRAISERANAFLTLPNPFVTRHRTRVLEFAAKNRLPAIYPSGGFADAGGLMSYGVDYRDLNRRLAYYVDRILKGAKPSDLPVEQPTKFELVVNLNTATALGLTIPAKVLTWADRVISDGSQVSEKNVASTYPIESPRLKIPRVSVLTPGRGGPSFALEAIRQRLYELGYVEGRNIVLEVRGTAGDDEQRLSLVAAELLGSNVDIIVATNSRQTRAIQRLTRTIPIVMATTNDRVGSEFSDSPHRPEGNLTGLSYVGSELNGKRFKLLKETVPRLSRVAILTTSKETSEVQATARSLGLKLQIFTVTKPNEIENAFALMLRGKTDALSVLSQANLLNRQTIVDLAAKNRLPAIYPRREYVEAGGLVSYGPSHAELYRRAAAYIDKILKGAKPADLPVERVTKTELVINLKTAADIGLTISPKVLMSADQVIK
jgi:putative ABC transport system substrate-binding protein